MQYCCCSHHFHKITVSGGSQYFNSLEQQNSLGDCLLQKGGIPFWKRTFLEGAAIYMMISYLKARAFHCVLLAKVVLYKPEESLDF